MKRRTVVLALMLGGMAAPLSAFAGPPRGHEKKGRPGKHDHGHPVRDRHRPMSDRRWERGDMRRDAYADLVYAGITAALARQYARDAGLRGYASLPPGIRKNLARGRPLPPGLAKRKLPPRLLGRLPRYPGYEWRVSGTDLLLISATSVVVADVLYDVFD